jgi:hypothetical protein
MNEEQRYQQKIKIETERNKCLKGIWDELKDIRQALTAIALGEAVKLGPISPRISFLNQSDCSMTQYRANCESDAGDWERAKEKPVEGWK